MQLARINHLSSTESNALMPLFPSKPLEFFCEKGEGKQLNPNDYLITDPSSTFFVKVKGDSMVDAGIFENDILVIDRSRNSQAGNIVLAILNGEFTIRYLGRSATETTLIPANKNYPTIQVTNNHLFEIWGVITGSMRKF
jgi:DNA polymerase V